MSIAPPIPASRDRRVARTHEALRSALLALMVERGWDAVDVQSLCERANVGRSTFYLHFQNKGELLRSSLGDLRASLQPPAAAAAGPQRWAFLGGLLDHVYEHRQVFRAVVDRRSGHFVQDRFRDMLVELLSAELPAGRRSWQAQAAAQYLAGALFQLLAWWLAASRPQRPRDIESLFLRLSEPTLHVVGTER